MWDSDIGIKSKKNVLFSKWINLQMNIYAFINISLESLREYSSRFPVKKKRNTIILKLWFYITDKEGVPMLLDGIQPKIPGHV